MNKKQSEALEIAVAGHSFLILGAAGTGKTKVVTEIYRLLCNKGKNVKLTCTTGIACSQYGRELNATTLHSFLGLSDGRYSPQEINAIHQNVPAFSFVKENVSKLDCLIVDECSMMSKRTFDTIMAVLAMSKQRIQMILVGDFYQLPPVANTLFEDDGEFCFQSNTFEKVFKHRVVLKDIQRTHDENLQKLITEVFHGNISKESVDFLNQLKRPLNSSESVKLFSKNDLVDDFNRKMILKQTGPLYEFASDDSGDAKALDRITAPRILWIKVGTPVILLQNLSDTLVNGLVGEVQSVTDTPVVTFPALKKTISIRKMKFTIFDPSLKRNIAEREQYPLKPAYGLTIHKAQGMSLDRVVIDCRDIFRPGQLGVALSRATSPNGLQVVNFHRRYVMKPPALVTEFMKIGSSKIMPDLTCCQSVLCTEVKETVTEEVTDTVATEVEQPSLVQQPEERIMLGVTAQPSDAEIRFAEEELDDEFNDVISSVVSEEVQAINFDFPEGFEFNVMKEGLGFEKEVTDSHKRINEIVSHLDEDKLKLFTKKILLKLGIFAKNHMNEDDPDDKSPCIPEKKIAAFYSDVHVYNTSEEYIMHCLELFTGEEEFVDEHMIVAYKIVEFVRSFYIERKVNQLKLGSVPIYRRFVTNASRSRIRYVAGYCVSSLRAKYEKEKKSKMFSRNEEEYVEAKCRVDIINSLKEDEHYLSENSEYKETLLDVQRRQYVGKKLTNVNDKLFEFFITITNVVLELLIYENLVKYGREMYLEAYNKMYANTSLFEQFLDCVSQSLSVTQSTEDENEPINNLLNEIVVQSSQCLSVYVDIINKFLHIFIAQFRRDVKDTSKVEKKMAHRKQIRVSAKLGKGKTAKKSKKEYQISEHEAEVHADESEATTLSPQATPQQKSTIAGTSTTSVKGRETRSSKKRRSTQIEEEDSSDNNDAETSLLPLPTKDTSTQSKTGIGKVGKRKSKGRGQSKRTMKVTNQPQLEKEPKPSTSQGIEETDNEVCVVCLTFDKEEMWIQCDSCDSWYHRGCAGLRSNDKWMKYQKKGSKFFCKDCS